MPPENRSPRAPPPAAMFCRFFIIPHFLWIVKRNLTKHLQISKIIDVLPKMSENEKRQPFILPEIRWKFLQNAYSSKIPIFCKKTVPKTALVSGTVFYASVSGASSVSEGPLRIRSSALLFSCVERRRRLISACMASISAATRPRIFFSFTERVSNSSSRR